MQYAAIFQVADSKSRHDYNMLFYTKTQNGLQFKTIHIVIIHSYIACVINADKISSYRQDNMDISNNQKIYILDRE